MSKRFTKIISFMVALIMLTTLFGCGKDTSSEVSQSSESTTTDSSASTSSAPAEKEKVTLKIFASAVAADLVPGVQSDPIAKEIENKTGVIMDITPADGQDYSTKLAALVASGDLPDIFFIPGVNEQAIVLNSNSALDCTELVNTNGKDMLQVPIINSSIEYSKKYLGNGKLYFINLMNGGQGAPTYPTVVPQLRWDLYKKMGYPKIENYDDFLNVLAEMQKQYPTAANGKKTYGMSFFTDWGDWGILYGQMMLGYEPIAGTTMAVDLNDYSKLLPNITDKNSTYWQMAELYYKAKQMGILDPDSVTQKYDQFIAKAKAEQALSIITGWDRDTGFTGQPEEGFMGIPIINNGKFVATAESTMGERRYCISAKSKNPDRAMDLFNYICTVEGSKTVTNGVKGQSWDTVDGKDVYKTDVESVFLSNKQDETAWKKQTGIGMYRLFCGLAGSYKDDAGNYIDIKNSEGYLNKQASSNPKLQDFMTHYNVKTPGEPWFKVENWSYDAAYGGALPILPDDLKAINDNITNYKNTNIYKVILSKNDEEFNQRRDEFIKDLLDMGAQKVVDYYSEQWSKIAPEITSILKK